MSKCTHLARIINLNQRVNRLLGDFQRRWHTDLFTVGADATVVLLGMTDMARAIVVVLRLLVSERRVSIAEVLVGDR